MDLKPEVTARKYCVMLPLDAMIRLLNRERASVSGDMLSTAMDDLMGVYETEYAGHFGSAVFYTVEDEYDQPDLHKTIVALIRKYSK